VAPLGVTVEKLLMITLLVASYAEPGVILMWGQGLSPTVKGSPHLWKEIKKFSNIWTNKINYILNYEE
jgi:hypothetical protein